MLRSCLGRVCSVCFALHVGREEVQVAEFVEYRRRLSSKHENYILTYV